MRRVPALLVVLAMIALPLRACLWDRDTLATEARGLPDVIRIITGRFDRNPPLYYQMRLDRSAKRIASEPADLGAYDDAGVASDRLGKGDEAIAWMDRKKDELDRLEKEAPRADDLYKDYRYRYLANIGTFRVHRWIRSGADRSKIDEVKAARDEIAAAIALNPEAHFGRERYQLAALEWIIDPAAPPDKESYHRPFLFLPREEDRSKAVRGISGLIALGEAWQSVDVFQNLGAALRLDGRRSSVALLARLRADELIDAGRRSLDPEAPPEPELLKRTVAMNIGGTVDGGVEDQAPVLATFRSLRAEAESWHKARTDYMMARLRKGLHPDTDSAFWSEYRDAGPPSIDGIAKTLRLAERRRKAAGISLIAAEAGAGLAIPALALYALARWRRGRRKPAPVSVDTIDAAFNGPVPPDPSGRGDRAPTARS